MRRTRRRAAALVADGPVIPAGDALTVAEAQQLRDAELVAAGYDPAADANRGVRAPAWLPIPLQGGLSAYSGAVGLPVRVTPHWESTAAIRALYPFIAGVDVPQVGAFFGNERFSQGRFCIDPWHLYTRKTISSLGLWLCGVIGSGKSAAAKSIAMRSLEFGHPFRVPGDIRGEWVAPCLAVGGSVYRVGPGQVDRLNALAMPKKPADRADEEWWDTVRNHWQELLEAIARTFLPGQRGFLPAERAALSYALLDAARWDTAGGRLDRCAPIHIGLIQHLLRHPSDGMADALAMSVQQATDVLRDLMLVLGTFLPGGPLGGLIDADRPTNAMDPDEPATVIDLSRIRQSDAAVGTVMAAAQSIIELQAAHRKLQQWIFYEEWWRLTPFVGLMARINAGQRVARDNGAAIAIITHRMSDGTAAGGEAGQYAKDILADCEMRVVYRQRSDALDAVGRLGGFTDTQIDMLPTLQQGSAMWMIGDRPYLIDHRVVRGTEEWDLITTDAAMVDTYYTLRERSTVDLYSNVAELHRADAG